MHSEYDDVSTEGHRGPGPAGTGPAGPPAGGARGDRPRPEEGASGRDRPEEEGADIRARLEEIDKRLAELRATLENHPEGPGDQVDAAATLTLQDEIMMMVETLENERRRLADRLRGR